MRKNVMQVLCLIALCLIKYRENFTFTFNMNVSLKERIFFKKKGFISLEFNIESENWLFIDENL
jgi:hypothetical protein